MEKLNGIRLAGALIDPSKVNIKLMNYLEGYKTKSTAHVHTNTQLENEKLIKMNG
jgi:hypothetical protein